MLNWRDLTQKPQVFAILPASLPSRLVYNARFAEADYLEARFDENDVVCLPTGMAYLPEEPQPAQKGRRRR